MPGDEIVVDADLVATRAITIGCGPDAVWPWIAQVGQGRGGWYSYDFLENLVGCDINRADRIVPAWQQVQVGDEVRLAPGAALQVAVALPGHALVLHGSVPIGGKRPPFDFTWAFVLADRKAGTTRLVVRERYRYRSWWAGLVVEPTEVISFVMSRQMLCGIRSRAEQTSPDLTGVSHRQRLKAERTCDADVPDAGAAGLGNRWPPPTAGDDRNRQVRGRLIRA